GYGCVECHGPRRETTLIEAGVLRFKAQQSLEARLEQLHEAIEGLIEQLRPQRVAVEKLFAHYKHPRTAIVMGHARGVILLAAEQAKLSVEHLPSTEVKKSICGNGHASKQQIQRAVAACYRLPEPPSPPDVADAIAIATTAARRIL
ncbi:MAG: crossover junction endodeoxyribonuclease RuvC, partial [Phycisphaeraceae bacterium]|nr:crossover junction endodeoxyribonuclease RuvC [Phycisphaeraceae bacterium]